MSRKSLQITLIGIFFTTLVGVGYSLMPQDESKNTETQDEGVTLPQEMEETVVPQEPAPKASVDIVDINKLVNLTRYCDHNFSNFNQPVDETITNTLRSADQEFAGYLAEGYRLREVCRDANKILLFLDFWDGYWKKELYSSADRTVLGISDSRYQNIKFYPVSIEDFRFEGTGGMACNFDVSTDEKILYICVDAHDGGTTKTWYAYDVRLEENLKVKYSYGGRYDNVRDRVGIINAELIELFSQQD